MVVFDYVGYCDCSDIIINEIAAHVGLHLRCLTCFLA